MTRKKGNRYIISANDGTARIELNRRGKENFYTIIDLDDLEKVLSVPFTWYARYDRDSKSYYAVATEYLDMQNSKRQTRTVLLHQFILETKDIVDHINHDTIDNRKSNLRKIKQQNNLTNRKSRNSNNKSGYRNVSLSGNRWIVQLQVDGKNTNLGTFPLDKLEEAGLFAEKMRQKYYGEFAGNN